MVIDATEHDFRLLNEKLRSADGDCHIVGCCGERFIAAGMKEKNIVIDGVPGNALGAYLDGAKITVNANAQDAVGDTMNDGMIVVKGNIGDAAGYAMRGGKIYVRNNAGYRAGIHMKEYKDKIPVMIIGGRCGSFLGEYQAGGVIIVLGMGDGEGKIVGNFPCTGMHGGKVFLRGAHKDIKLPSQVSAKKAGADDIREIAEYLSEYCKIFGLDADEITDSEYTLITPDSSNPYKQLYVAN